MPRADGRLNDSLRKVQIVPSYLKYAEGSVLITIGDTKVVCVASVEEKVPPFLKGSEQGWITAEYSMLPRSTRERTPRETGGRVSGRTYEIQRLIGRSLRSIVNLEHLGERTIWLDCDVLQADGGTRTAAITGAYVALVKALDRLKKEGRLKERLVLEPLAAVSVGLVGGRELLDLSYLEDSQAEVDMNLVMTESGKIVEIQGSAERKPFNKEQMDRLISLAQKGILVLIEKQKEVLTK